jgi:hypothetical protein
MTELWFGKSSDRACRFQSGGYGSDDLLVNFFYGEIALDEDDAGWFAEGDFAIFLPDAGVEGTLLQFEAIFVGARIWAGLGLDSLIAAAGAEEGRLEAGKEQEGQVGLEIAAEETVEFEDGFGAELAPSTLVGLGGVGEAVTKDDSAGVEGGLDDFGDGLGAIGKHEGHFRHGREAGGAGIEDEGANAVAGDGSAGLADEDGVLWF